MSGGREGYGNKRLPAYAIRLDDRQEEVDFTEQTKDYFRHDERSFMHVLVVGGSGLVGSLVVPVLAETHELRIFDRNPPQSGTYDYVQGDVTRYDDLASAMAGMDALLYMAMGSINWKETPGIASAYDVNIKGLHLALRAAHDAGVNQAVYTSTMSICVRSSSAK